VFALLENSLGTEDFQKLHDRTIALNVCGGTMAEVDCAGPQNGHPDALKASYVCAASFFKFGLKQKNGDESN
jgi:hypothetical protein